MIDTPSEPEPRTGQPVGLKVADPSPAPRPGPVTLEGRFGRLEKLQPSHAAALWTHFKNQPQLWTYIGAFGPFDNEKDFAAHIERFSASADPYVYAIVDNEKGPVGYFTLMEIRPQHRVIEVGHVMYSPALQRSPLATEVQYLLAKYIFETLGYRRYEWKCNSLNAPSRRAGARLGFTYEGILRQYVIAKGRNRDNAYFSMLDSEWPQRKANFERWLSPDNFDASGKQKINLTALNADTARP
ncbi:MAG: GNAT family N-acetyltransferase [Pseudolabrys sp.]|nr:GNAT family N-acetyltransferase [Pseudolabrys sp.]